MSRRRIGRRKPKGQNKSKSPWRNLLRNSLAALGVFATVLGVYVTVLPRLSVEADKSLDPAIPLKTTFIIVNDGLFSLYEVSYDFRMEHLEAKTKQGGKLSFHGSNNIIIKDAT